MGGICDDSITMAGVAAVRGAGVAGESGVAEGAGEENAGFDGAVDGSTSDTVGVLQAAEMVTKRNNPTHLRIIGQPLKARGEPLRWK